MSIGDGAPFDIFATMGLGLTLKKKSLPASVPLLPPFRRLESSSGEPTYFIAMIRTSLALRS